ncbi:hypothetical protein V2I01_09275 [Micromonospora sp. BRA006-A]|nr:hypothetical protein [Micromonospora sp. BRA006-A]
MTRQFAWLLGTVAGSLIVFAFIPDPMALGVALVLGGAAIAPRSPWRTRSSGGSPRPAC